MSDLITYDDKIRLKSQNVSDKYKVTAEDMNEIKEVVNTNVEIVDEINNPENWVSVGTTAPTDGRRVWFEKGKNLYNTSIKTNNSGSSNNNIVQDTSNKLEIQGVNGHYSGIYKKYQLVPNTQYTISTYYSDLGNSARGQLYYKLGTECENIATNNRDGTIQVQTTKTSMTFTTDSTGLVVILFCCNWTTNNGHIVYNEIMFEEGSTATTYEPSIEKSINVDDESFISMSDLVNVSANQPSDGKRVWFAKGKNLFDKNTQLYKSNSYIDGSGQEGSNTEWSIFKTYLKPNTTYTLTNSGASGTPGYVLYNSSSVRVGGSNYSNRSHITFTTTSDTSYMLESVVANTSSDRYDLDIFQIEKGSTATSYEAYINPTINVDGEEWYNKSFAIKTKVYPSVTTASTGYYNLNLKCNVVAIIGYTHDPIASATRLQLYSNEQGWWSIRCSVNDGVYGERTITNLKIYYI